MFANKFILLFLLLFISKGEPQKICDPSTPFQRKDQTCGSFNDICVKTNDEDCEYFKKACQQCPPSNFSVLTFMGVRDMKNQISQSDVKLDWIKNQLNVGIVAACLAFILFNFILSICILFIEIRRCKQSFFRRQRSRNHNDDEERLAFIDNHHNNNNQQMDNVKILQEIKEIIYDKQYSSIDSIASYKLRFQIANQFDETELFVSKFDNVIKIKKSICDRNMNMNDYKRMIMKYKGVTLDNNQYLLACIDSTNIYPIFCEFDDNIDADAMIVIKLKCDNIYPEMLQIWKYQTIKHLKIIISKLNKTNHEDLLIFYKSNQLDDDYKTIDDYKIEDNDLINAVNKSQEMQKISMKSVFNDKETISIEISKFETVSSIINKCIQKIKDKMVTNHFAVFLNKKLLENEKFIYEYNIDSKSLIEFCYLKSLKEIEDISPVRNFDYIPLSAGRNKSLDQPVLLAAYSREHMAHVGDYFFSMIVVEQLKMFLKTKSHRRFIQLFGVVLDDKSIYVETECTKLTMRNFLSNNDIHVSIRELSKWANQMLEGLKHLHSNNIILKDMNPMDIWVDDNRDIKLPSFNMTEYLNHLDDEDSNKYRHKDGVLAYVAPEILEGKSCDASVDVWSLGAVMIEIMQGSRLFPFKNESETIAKIKESHTIEYDKSNKPEELIDFIDCCVKGDPKERSTIDQLMQHEFIQKYL